MSHSHDDLDTFLSLLESKLRGPFSSLDLAKTVTTNQLRGSLSKSEYLKNVGKVFSRAEKTTQLRVLIGLLGLDPSTETDDEIHTILVNSQTKSQHVEEWVRVISGLVHGMMFVEASVDDGEMDYYEGDDFGDEMSRRLRGKEAEDILRQTCSEIIERVRRIERESADLGEEHTLATSDVDPTFAPFRYALLHRDLLERAIPEVKSHNHFQIDKKAEVLNMDTKLEALKAQEEYEHSFQTAPQSAIDTEAKKVTTLESAIPILPGLNNKSSSATGSKTNNNAPKTNMFIPAKKPTAFALANSKVQKVGLKIRKAGAAQDLLKSRKQRLAGSVGGGQIPTKMSLQAIAGNTNAANLTARGRANRLMNANSGASKMKMLDMNEVQGLEKVKLEKEQQFAKGEKSKRKALLSGQKRKASNAAPSSDGDQLDIRATKAAHLSDPNDSTPQNTSINSFEDGHNDDDGHNFSSIETTFAANDSNHITKDEDLNQKTFMQQTPFLTAAAASPFTDAGALATAALNAYQAQLTTMKPVIGATGETENATPSHRQNDWRVMLREKSNRLSSEDRFRIQQFFVDKFNPTPDKDVYKMKLHEERTTDPKSGEGTKETYYLELDYNTFTSKQSKKTKRYKD
jgi:hypothetical protein